MAATTRRAWRRRGAAMLVSLSLALAAAELCARALAPDWLRARMREVDAGRSLGSWASDEDWPVERDGDVAVRFRPATTFTVRHDEYVHDVRTDEYGGRMTGAAARGDRPIVPVFGDSFAFGLGVRDEEAFVSLVDAALPVRLVNFGLPGSALVDHLDALERLHARLPAPSFCVFVVYLGNDLDEIVPATGDPSVVSDWLFTANRALDQYRVVRRWYFVQWARALAVRAANAAQHEPQIEQAFVLMDRAVPLDRQRAAFEGAVDRLMADSVRLRFTPLAIVIPDRFQVDAVMRRDKAALYGTSIDSYDPLRANRLVAAALSSRGVAFVDTTPCLQGKRGQYYVRDMHLTAAGHATVAACVAPFLAAHLAMK